MKGEKMKVEKLNGVHSRTYRLISPGVLKEEIIERELKAGEVSVEPTLASICHADLRYFTGNRRPEALAKKLPMALLHEGIGRVAESRSDSLQVGDPVVIVPNLPGYLLKGKSKAECCPSCQKGLPDNYCEEGAFLGSGYDGIAQNRLVLPEKCTIPIPREIPHSIAVLSELCSVSYHALSHIQSKLKSARVGVWGDGPVGFLTAAMLHHVYRLDSSRLKVFGAVEEKLAQFHFAERHLVQDYDFLNEERVDVAVECTGGSFSESAINQAIDHLKPGGSLVLMGVTEERVPINTRDVLEKRITLYGSSRSSVEDYHVVISAMKDPDYQGTLSQLLPEKPDLIRSVDDLTKSMKKEASHKSWKKVLLDFYW